jgi:hypothetical protein
MYFIVTCHQPIFVYTNLTSSYLMLNCHEQISSKLDKKLFIPQNKYLRQCVTKHKLRHVLLNRYIDNLYLEQRKSPDLLGLWHCHELYLIVDFLNKNYRIIRWI